MIKLNKLRRTAVRLVCLLAALFALSPHASAYENPRVVGEQYGGWKFNDNSSSWNINDGVADNTTVTFTIQGWKGGKFKICAPWDNWGGQHLYSTGGTLTNNSSAQNLSQQNDESVNGAMQLPADATGKDVTFTLALGNGKTPSTLKASWTAGGGSGSGFYINGLTATGIEIYTSDNNKFIYQYTPAAGATGNKQIYIWDGTDSKDVGPKNGNATVTFSNNSYTYQDCQANSNKWNLNVESGYTYEFTYYHEYKVNNVPQHRLEIKRLAETSSISLPCLPARVTNRRDPAQWNSITSTNPVVYLLANVLNGERPSPEWEMISTDGGNTYTLDFTARNSNMVQWGDPETRDWYYYVKVYDSKTSSGANKSSQSFGNLFNWNSVMPYDKDHGMLYPGRRYRAIYTRSTESLTFEDISNGEKNYPPYISLVGYHFKQVDEYDTPTSGKKNTSGWQEAWIQFDKDGNVALDMNNKVMYNTMWPPKEAVYFYVQPTAGGEYRELTSDRLQLNAQTSNGIGVDGDKLVLTGAQWKELLKDDENYNNLFNSSFNDNPGGKHCLRDTDKYIRYVATNVWILGSAKIWTGWTGTYTQDSNNQANWSNHANWGIGGNKDNNGGTTISKGEPWNVMAQAGNFMFSQPTFFKTVELFYCVDKNDSGDTTNFYAMYDHCIFYTTEGFGNPQIDAKSRKNFTVADYDITVENVPTGCSIKGYTVTRYDATTNQPCTVRREPTGKVNATVISGDNLSISADEFNRIARFATNDDDSKEKTLADGRYYYELTVTFIKEDGATATETVISPIVTILNPDVNTRLLTAQLVELTDEGRKKLGEIEGSASNYQYITYSDNLGTVYGVSYAEDQIVPVSLKGSLEDYKVIYSDSKYGSFTDMVILSSPLSSKFSGNSTTYPISGVGSYTLEGAKVNDAYNVPAGTKVCGGKQDNGSFREIRKIDLTTTANAPEYNVLLDYTYYPEEGSGVAGLSKPEQNSVYLTVPEPKIKKARIEVYHPGDEIPSPDGATFEFEDVKSFKFRSKVLSSVRYQALLSIVETEEPNMTSELDKKMKNKVSKPFELTYNGGEILPVNSTTYWCLANNLSDFEFEGEKKVSIKNNLESAGIPIYKRGAMEGSFKGLEIADEAPGDANVEVAGYPLVYVYTGEGTDKKEDLVETLQLNVTLPTSFTKNQIKFGETDRNAVDLLHHGVDEHDGDYFYITVVEKSKDDKGNIVYSDPILVDDGEGKTEKCEFVVKTSQLKAGYPINIVRHHGHWWESNGTNQLDFVKKNLLGDKIEVRISYLYPVHLPGRELGEKPGLNRVSADHSDRGNFDSKVVKSAAATWTPKDIATSVEGIEGVSEGSVKAGVGFIEVAGKGVEIYSAEGIMVAAGEGRHDLNAGVYVVRVSGRTQKVIVR